jgi:uncharacterized LabA/DUF88 family protein
MALNIFPRQARRETPSEAAPAPAFETESDAAAVAAAVEESTGSRRRSRSRRGGRAAATELQADVAGAEAPSAAAPEPEPGPGTEAEAGEAPRRRSRSRSRKADDTETAVEAPSEEPVEAPSPARRSRQAAQATPAASSFDPAPLVRAIEQQGKQIEALTRAIQDGLRSNGASAQVARVGVFVDVANVELGADRARARFDWGKVLRMLTRDRSLARAIAYAPVHDDPQVSRETQRFVEPFLDRGYKIVTKPLKRFSDGTIKANVDIEMALDIMNMLDRLDVVCLVSGDGDFEPLVRAAQERGIRVEIAAMSNSCATNLRNAADTFVDLLAHKNELRA